jgi:predicted TIM-barrel fold metal-dependent hydrolase
VVAEVLPPQLVRAANTTLRTKVLFGSDVPVITPDRWRADVAALDTKPGSWSSGTTRSGCRTPGGGTVAGESLPVRVVSN